MNKKEARLKDKEALERLQEELQEGLRKIKEMETELRGFHNEGDPLPSNLEIKDTDSGYTVKLSLRPKILDRILRRVEGELQELKGEYEYDIQKVKDALNRIEKT